MQTSNLVISDIRFFLTIVQHLRHVKKNCLDRPRRLPGCRHHSAYYVLHTSVFQHAEVLRMMRGGLNRFIKHRMCAVSHSVKRPRPGMCSSRRAANNKDS